MSPRVKPSAADRQRGISEAYERTYRTSPDHALEYGDAAGNSFFRDLAVVAASDQRGRDAWDDPVLRGRDQGEMDRPASSSQPPIQLARTRLERAAGAARFDLASSGSSSTLIPTSQLPPELAGLFEVSASAEATVAAALGSKPIPDGTGLTVAIARLTSGSSVTIQAAELDANSETDPAFALASSTLAYATGHVDVSRQLLDRAGNGTAGTIDAVIAEDLGRKAGQLLDTQILNGSGSSGEVRGLLNVSGINATTYTDASPTPAELVSKIGANYSATATADGRLPDLLIVHPRRLAWAATQASGGDDAFRRLERLYSRGVVASTAVPTTLGAGTNEDRAITLRSDATRLFTDVRIDAHEDPGSANLTVRFLLTLRIALVTPAPTGIGVLSGTGLVTPTFA